MLWRVSMASHPGPLGHTGNQRMENHEFQKEAENSWENLSHTLPKTLRYGQCCSHHVGLFGSGSQSVAIKALLTSTMEQAIGKRGRGRGRGISRLGKVHTAKEPGVMGLFYFPYEP